MMAAMNMWAELAKASSAMMTTYLRLNETMVASASVIGARMTVMGKDPVGDEKGIVIAQHDLLDEAGRLVFSCLTRSLLARR